MQGSLKDSALSAWEAHILRSGNPMPPLAKETGGLERPPDVYPQSYSAVQTDFTSVYCFNTSWPISRPQPDCLYPPNGNAASKML